MGHSGRLQFLRHGLRPIGVEHLEPIPDEQPPSAGGGRRAVRLGLRSERRQPHRKLDALVFLVDLQRGAFRIHALADGV